jgi:hypothetical protein
MDALGRGDVFLFEGFRLDPRGGGLFRRDERGTFVPVVISSRALGILGVLVERPGDLVSRDAIITAVWPTTVVEDNKGAAVPHDRTRHRQEKDNKDQKGPKVSNSSPAVRRASAKRYFTKVTGPSAIADAIVGLSCRALEMGLKRPTIEIRTAVSRVIPTCAGVSPSRIFATPHARACTRPGFR